MRSEYIAAAEALARARHVTRLARAASDAARTSLSAASEAEMRARLAFDAAGERLVDSHDNPWPDRSNQAGDGDAPVAHRPAS